MSDNIKLDEELGKIRLRREDHLRQLGYLDVIERLLPKLTSEELEILSKSVL